MAEENIKVVIEASSYESKNIIELVGAVIDSKQVELINGFISEKLGCAEKPIPTKALRNRYKMMDSNTIYIWGIIEEYLKNKDNV